MSDEIERDLATRICGCATERQRRQDIKLIRAYGDRREREALWKAAEVVKAVPEYAAFDHNNGFASSVCGYAHDQILALIPKATP